MKLHLFNREDSRTLKLLVAALILSCFCCSCNGTRLENVLTKANVEPDKTTASASKVVGMTIIQRTPNRMILEIFNRTPLPVYFFYDHSVNSESLSQISRYWLRCTDSKGAEKTYNQFQSDIVPTLEPLAKDDSFRFEISPLPETVGHCRASVLYYDDPRVFEVINKRLLDANSSEQDLIEHSKKSVEVQFDIDRLQ